MPQGFSLSFQILRRGIQFNTGSTDQVMVQTNLREHEVIRLSSPPAPTKSADMTQQQKIAAALLKAGISNPIAWSAAGVSVAAPSSSGVRVITVPTALNENGNNADQSPSAPEDDFDLHPPVVLRKGTNNKTFLISWRSQQQLARSLGWKCTLMIWGGPLLALLSLYFFLGIRNLF